MYTRTHSFVSMRWIQLCSLRGTDCVGALDGVRFSFSASRCAGRDGLGLRPARLDSSRWTSIPDTTGSNQWRLWLALLLRLTTVAFGELGPREARAWQLRLLVAGATPNRLHLLETSMLPARTSPAAKPQRSRLGGRTRLRAG